MFSVQVFGKLAFTNKYSSWSLAGAGNPSTGLACVRSAAPRSLQIEIYSAEGALTLTALQQMQLKVGEFGSLQSAH
jgi:hypothetical protein